MKKVLIPLLFIIMLSLVTISSVSSEKPDLWLPEGFDWDLSYSMVCDAFYGNVYEMPPVEGEKGTYTCVMGGGKSEGCIFTFCNDKLVGVCVAFGASYSGIPSIAEIDNVKGYTRSYESRSGNWVYIESGLRGYEVLGWENSLGMKTF